MTSPTKPAGERALREAQPHSIALMIEDTRGLSAGVELRDELLASIAISLKRLADQFENWRHLT